MSLFVFKIYSGLQQKLQHNDHSFESFLSNFLPVLTFLMTAIMLNDCIVVWLKTYVHNSLCLHHSTVNSTMLTLIILWDKTFKYPSCSHDQLPNFLDIYFATSDLLGWTCHSQKMKYCQSEENLQEAALSLIHTSF